jgi:predicted signal transduction protein with EAL and GGDEF domain
MSANVVTESRTPVEVIPSKPPPEISLEDLWNGIAQDLFFPHFQPKVDLQGRQLLGVEALMRWRHPEHGLLSAGSFLPLIADNFLFDDLTAIMLDKSVGQCRKWRRQGLDVQISINLSPVLLLTPGLADRIDALGGIFSAGLAAYLVYAHNIPTAANTGFSLNQAGMWIPFWR